MKSRNAFTIMALIIGVAAPLACASSGDDGGSNGCVALVTCCTTLAGAEAEECSAVANDPAVTADECGEELSAMQAAGACGAAGSSNGSGTATPNVPSTSTGCAALIACCAMLPVSEEPTECTAVATGGTTTACTESLTQYETDGYCTGSTTPETFCTSNDGSSLVCNIDVTINLGYCAEGNRVSACPTEGLDGCCMFDIGVATEQGWNAQCFYDDDGEGKAACDESNGSWITAIPSAESLQSMNGAG